MATLCAICKTEIIGHEDGSWTHREYRRTADHQPTPFPPDTPEQSSALGGDLRTSSATAAFISNLLDSRDDAQEATTSEPEIATPDDQDFSSGGGGEFGGGGATGDF
jgi:uncharacterized membrane protein YgcG